MLPAKKNYSAESFGTSISDQYRKQTPRFVFLLFFSSVLLSEKITSQQVLAQTSLKLSKKDLRRKFQTFLSQEKCAGFFLWLLRKKKRNVEKISRTMADFENKERQKIKSLPLRALDEYASNKNEDSGRTKKKKKTLKNGTTNKQN